MKNLFYLLIMMCLINTSVFAQDSILLADYEPGSAQPNRTFAWNNNNFTAGVDNPNKTGINISNGVAKFHITSQYSDAITISSFDEPISLGIYPFIKLKVLSDSAISKTINIEVIDINGYSQNLNQTLSETVNSAWEEVAFDFSNIVTSSSISFIKEIIIKIDYGSVIGELNEHNIYYIDDIEFSKPSISLTENDTITCFAESFSGNPWWISDGNNFGTLLSLRTVTWGGSALTAPSKYYNGTDSLKLEMVDWSIAVAELYPSSVRPALSKLEIKDINIEGTSNLELNYKLRWKASPHFGESPTIEYSVDGKDWVEASTTNTIPLSSGSWADLSYDLSAATGSKLKIRLANNVSTNFFIDEIKLKGNPVFANSVIITTEGNATEIATDKGTLQMYATVLPNNAKQEVFWSVINGIGSASIGADGLLTALSNGTVTVKARALDVWGTQDKTIEISISNQAIPVDSIVFAADNYEISSISQEIATTVTFFPENSFQPAIFSSQDTLIAIINEIGTIKGVSNGTVWVFAETEDGSHKDSININVNIQLDSIRFTADVYEINSLESQVGTKVTFYPVFLAQNITYSSADTTIATIDEKGIIQPVQNGNVWLYAKAQDGNHMDSIMIVITLPLNSFEFSSETTEITSLDQEIKTKVAFYPAGATQNVIYSSQDTQIATIDENGIIIGLSNGEVWMYAFASEQNIKDSLLIKVAISLDSIQFTASTYELTRLDETIATQVTFYPAVAATNIVYSSKDNSIATIDNAGVIHPVAFGNVWIYAQTEDGSLKDSMNINIVNPVNYSTFEVVNVIDGTNISSPEDFSGQFKIGYDAENFYMVFNLTDDMIVNSGGNSYEVDNIEIYISLTNSKNPLWPRGSGWPNSSYVTGDYQLRLVPGVDWETNNSIQSVQQTYQETDGGYTFELTIPYSAFAEGFTPVAGSLIGFDILASDNDSNPFYRDQVSWNSVSGMLWNDPSYWGTLELQSDGTFKKIEDTEAPLTPANVTAMLADNKVTLTWDASTDNTCVEQYIIAQNGVVIDTIVAKQTNNNWQTNELEPGVYNYSIKAVDLYKNTSDEGLSNQVEVVDLTNGIATKSFECTIYPNPANEYIIISNRAIMQSVMIYNNQSKLEKQFEANTTSSKVDITNLEKGIYFVRVQTCDGVTVYKILKN